jgi:hypothetical protein
MAWMIGCSNPGRVKKILLSPKQPATFWGYTPASLCTGIRILSQQPGSKVNHSPSSSAKVKNDWYCTLLPAYVFIVWIRTSLLFWVSYFLLLQHSYRSVYMYNTFSCILCSLTPSNIHQSRQNPDSP